MMTALLAALAVGIALGWLLAQGRVSVLRARCRRIATRNRTLTRALVAREVERPTAEAVAPMVH